ncbi:MAG: DUF2190 family protein [Clostridiaceae bacterium]|nr:DUF2190 family protein [Clostridiaceae bacterium]
MKATYWQRGETLDYTPEENVEAGTVLNIGGRLSIAAANIPAGQLGHVHMVGVFRMDKAEGEAIEMGAAVYYSEASDAVTAAADGNIPAGYAAASAAAEDASILVKLPG